MGSVATPIWSPAHSCASLCARHLDGGACWVLELSGEADIATMDLLRDELAQLATVDRKNIVVDVTRLAFCDVASAHQLLTARRTLPVIFFGAQGPVQRVLDLVDALQMHRLPAYLSAVPRRGQRDLSSV